MTMPDATADFIRDVGDDSEPAEKALFIALTALENITAPSWVDNALDPQRATRLAVSALARADRWVAEIRNHETRPADMRQEPGTDG